MSISSLSSNSGLQQMVPQAQQRPSASDLSAEIMEINDLDSDSLLSIEEIGLSQEDFGSYDTDSDGFLSSDELEETLASKLDSVKDNELTLESFASLLSDMGVEVPEPPAGGTPPPGGGGGATASSEEEFDEADANEDGIVTDAEQAAYDGVTQDEVQDYALKLVSSLLDALKEESGDQSDSMDLSKFKSVMSMINNEIQETDTANKLNTYVSNLDLGLKTA
ncbi:MAG: hypothetical protein WA945_08140 [Arcobacteraceae bacterium]